MRRILHVDMDAFYASIEQRDDPRLAGLPVIVGADPDRGHGRGVVAACSYEARRFGIHSAQPIVQAWRRCPDAVFLRPRFDRYREISFRIMTMFREYTDLVEPLSIDEAFLDVTGSGRAKGSPVAIAREIRERIRNETGLSASVGVATNKFLAKLASDLKKPNALVVVPDSAEDILAFLAPLPIERLWGVGPRTSERLRKVGFRTVADLQAFDESELGKRLGRVGAHLSRLARGQDDRPVVGERRAKSISNEHTFGKDTSDPNEVHRTLARLADRVASRLRHANAEASTVAVKLRYSDFTTLVRQRTLARPTADGSMILREAAAMLDALPRSLPVRLIGIGTRHLSHPGDEPRQLDLFAGGNLEPDAPRLGDAIDRIHERFGEQALYRASTLR